MYTTVKSVFLVAALASGLAQADKYRKFGSPSGKTMHKRQAFDPPEEYGYGDTCEDAFGAGYVQCVPETDFEAKLCVNPDLGESCCDNLWGCPAESFCLVQDLCCPDGLTPEECGLENGIDVPEGFTPTTAAAIPETTSAAEEDDSTATTTFGSDEEETTPAATTTTGFFGGSDNETTSTDIPGPTSTFVPAGAAENRVAGGVLAAVVGVAAFLA